MFLDLDNPDKAKTYATIALAAAFCIIAVGIGFMVQKNASKIELPMHVTVSSGVIGFNVTEALEFGTMPPTGGGRKVVTVRNHLDSLKKVFIRAKGEMAPWVSVSQNEFPIKANETVNVSVFVSIPPGTAPGDYYGTLEITLG